MQWSLRLYLTKHLLQSSFRNIIYLKFPSPFLLLFPQTPNIALPSGAHRNRASFSPCYTLRGIFLKIRIHTLIWQFQYHHLNHQAPKGSGLEKERSFFLQRKKTQVFRLESFVRKMGLEPTRCNHHKILSLARLPVPTLPRIGCFKILYLSPTHINIP